MTPHPQRCIHEKVCRSVTKAINEIPGKLAFLKCEDLGECQFFEGHTPAASEREIEQLKKAIVEVLDTGFESSERDMVLVLDRIDAWEKGELRQGEQARGGDKP